MHLGALLAVLPLAAATVSFNGNVPTTLARGSSTTIKWTTDKNPVKILLVSDNYALIDVVCNVWITNDVSKACTSDKGEVTWTPNNDVPIGRYSLEARDADGQTASSNFISIVAQGQGPTTSSTSSQQPSTSATTGASSGTSTTTSGSSTGSQTSPTGSADGDPSDGNSSGLSTGAKVGAGVGAAIGGVGVLGLLGFLFFRMGKKAAAKKNNQKDDGSGGEEGDVAAAAAGAKTAAAAADDDNDKETGPAEMPAPDVIHEAPDYKQRLESPGGNAFFSELDATGGSFVLQSSRPSTAAGAAGAVSSPTDAGRPVTPQITVTAPEGESTDAAAVSPLTEPATTAAGSESNTTAADATTEPAAVEENTTTAESSGTATEAQADATTSGVDAPEKPTAAGGPESIPTKTEVTK